MSPACPKHPGHHYICKYLQHEASVTSSSCISPSPFPHLSRRVRVSISNQEPSALWDVTSFWILQYYCSPCFPKIIKQYCIRTSDVFQTPSWIMNHNELSQPFAKSYTNQVLHGFAILYPSKMIVAFILGVPFELALPSHFWYHNKRPKFPYLPANGDHRTISREMQRVTKFQGKGLGELPIRRTFYIGVNSHRGWSLGEGCLFARQHALRNSATNFWTKLDLAYLAWFCS